MVFPIYKGNTNFWQKFVILFLSSIFGFYFFLMISLNSYLYGTHSEPTKNTVILKIISFLDKAGFISNCSTAVQYAGVSIYLKTAIVIILFICLGFYFCSINKNIWIWKNHNLFIIGLIICVLAILFQINGTSIFCWAGYFPIDKSKAPIFGISQEVRSDEWAVWTPMAISQEYAGYDDINPFIHGGEIDPTWISIGGIPAKNKALVFKPLYWGFILFGSSYGLSILWVLRTLILFFSSYYCALIYTKNNKPISAAAACMITLSPYVQWWFSQSIAEVFFYPQLIILCLWKYLHTESLKYRIILSIISAWLLGCFCMIAYPAWLIPMVYLMVFLILYIFIMQKNQLSGKDIFILCTPLILVIGWLGVIIKDSWPTLQAIRDSVYPGSRFYTGHRLDRNLFTGIYGLLLPLSKVPVSNKCELSAFLSFAPIGMVLAFHNVIKEKKLDGFSIILLTVEIISWMIELFGVPVIVAKITLISQCTRLTALIGFVDVLLLIKGLSKRIFLPKISATLILILFSILNTYSIALKISPMRKGTILILLMFHVFIYAILLFPSYDKLVHDRFISFSIITIMIMAGGFVNPVQKGIDAISDSDLLNNIRLISDEQDALYIVESNFPIPNYLLLGKKSVFNSTQVYPEINSWKAIDPASNFIKIYNRLCHINVSITEKETNITLIQGDLIYLELNANDLVKLDIQYVISKRELSEINHVIFDRISETNGWKVYKITSKTTPSY